MSPSVCHGTFRGDCGTAVVKKYFCSRSQSQGEGHTGRGRAMCGKEGHTGLDLVVVGARESQLKRYYSPSWTLPLASPFWKAEARDKEENGLFTS